MTGAVETGPNGGAGNVMPSFQTAAGFVSRVGPAAALAVAVGVAGCKSPEDGRPRGGGRGGDGGNYVPGAEHPPSKIDGTKSWTDRPKV